MASSSADLTPMDYFLLGHLKGKPYAITFMFIEDVGAKTLAGMARVDANALRRVRGNVVWTPLPEFKWVEVASIIYCNYEASIVC
jgi:hypothetical protein